MSVLKNDRFIRALLRQPVDQTPIWIMRQAGRYLPEYRQLRARAGSFLNLCKTPELACEVTLQPLARFPLDAAIIFSDILTIPDAMGLGLYFSEGEGPKFKNPVRTIKDIEKLSLPEVTQDLDYVAKAIELTKKELNNKLPLIGFSGSPWTLACYMVEGGASKTFSVIKKMLFAEPQALQQLLSLLQKSVTDYLNMQINAGANAVMIFDSWGGVLTPRDYQMFSLQYMQQIVSGLQREKNGQRIPVILFTKNGGQSLEAIANSGCDAVGVDWTINLQEAKQRVGNSVALQGNMDPTVLYASPKRIRDEVQNILAQYGHGSGHVFNLGHGINQDVPPEHVATLVDAVHELSCKYHK